MKLKVARENDKQFTDVEGAEARVLLRQSIKEICQNILIPEPPYTTQLRERCFDALRGGQSIWTEVDENGQPAGTLIMLAPPPVRIDGVIMPDGTYKALTEEGKAYEPKDQEPKSNA